MGPKSPNPRPIISDGISLKHVAAQPQEKARASEVCEIQFAHQFSRLSTLSSRYCTTTRPCGRHDQLTGRHGIDLHHPWHPYRPGLRSPHHRRRRALVESLELLSTNGSVTSPALHSTAQRCTAHIHQRDVETTTTHDQQMTRGLS